MAVFNRESIESMTTKDFLNMVERELVVVPTTSDLSGPVSIERGNIISAILPQVQEQVSEGLDDALDTSTEIVTSNDYTTRILQQEFDKVKLAFAPSEDLKAELIRRHGKLHAEPSVPEPLPEIPWYKEFMRWARLRCA